MYGIMLIVQLGLTVKIKTSQALASVAQLVGASSSTEKGYGFSSVQATLPRFQVPSMIRAHMGGN